jgi:hypothetical protein
MRNTGPAANAGPPHSRRRMLESRRIFAKFKIGWELRKLRGVLRIGVGMQSELAGSEYFSREYFHSFRVKPTASKVQLASPAGRSLH